MNEWEREKSYCVMISVEPRETNTSLLTISGCGKAEVKLNLISWMILEYSEIILPIKNFHSVIECIRLLLHVSRNVTV